MTNGDVDYGLYQLPAGSPYRHIDLDPHRPEDKRLLLAFPNHPRVDEIDERIKASVKHGGPAAFLLSGREGTGRATLTRMILHRYAEHHRIGDALTVVKDDHINHDSLARITEILKAIRNAIVRHEHWSDREQLFQVVPDNEPGTISVHDLQSRAEHLVHYAGKPPAVHLALVIEGVQEDEFMDILATVFEYTSMVIVVTRRDYDSPDTASELRLDRRRRWKTWAGHLKLEPLTGEGVTELASNRWNGAAPEVVCPFDLDGLRTTFQSRKPTTRRALDWLRWLLEWRLKCYAGDGRWPDEPELALPGAWIDNMVSQAETAPKDE